MGEITKKTTQEPGVTAKAASYFKGVRAEWDKITWPDKRQVIVETVVVLGVVFFFTALVYCLDLIFTFLFRLIPGG